MKKAAIVIVTYNAQKYIKPLFLSLEKLDYAEFKVFVVDNGSKTSPKAEVRSMKLDIDVEVIEAGENSGFAGGNNVGMKKAVEQRYDYIVLLNQDMVVDKNWLGELVRVAEADERIGIVQAFMLLESDKSKIYTTGDRLNYLGIGYSENCGVPLEMYDPSKSVLSYAGGAAVLYKREVLEKVGYFDESFFMYHEDTDLSWRARLAGYEIELAREAVCYHDYQFKRNKKVLYWTERNRLAFLAKNFSLKTLILIAPMYVIMDIGMMGYALVTGWLPEKIRAYGWFLRNLGQILRKRRDIQKERKVSDRELKKYLVAGIEFEGFENPLLKYVANPMLKVYWVLIKKLI